MKKYILGIIALFLMVSVQSFAYTAQNCSKFYNASGSTEGSVTITGQSGSRIVIDKIIASTDLATGYVKIYEGIPTQAVVADYEVTSTKTATLGSSDIPVFVSLNGYSVKIGVTSTTKNAGIVLWHKE